MHRLCMPGYASILRALADHPETSPQVAERHGLFRNAAGKILRRLHDMRLIRVVEWVNPGPRIAARPVWSFTAGPDVPRPIGRFTGKPSRSLGATITKVRPRAELVAFGVLIKAMRKPTTINDLCERTGLHVNTVRRCMRHMRKIGLAFVAEWQVNDAGGKRAAMWRLGIDRPDKARPRLKTDSEINRKYREARAQRDRMLRITHALCANASVFTVAQAA